MKCFLRSSSDCLEDAKPFVSKASAVRQFQRDAEELDRFGQKHEASIHIADHIAQVVEYPDFVLSLGPRGGVKIERA